MLRVTQISFFVDPEGRPPEQLLHDWYSLVDIAAAPTSGGARVTVIQACGHARTIERDGVTYHFVKPGPSGLVPRDAFAHVLRDAQPDVLHVHGLGFPDDVSALAEHAPSIPILLQDHADRAPRFWQRRKWRRALAAASAVTFCARDQALPFERAGLLHPRTRVLAIPESTTRFTPGDQRAAQALTGIHGDPCALWVGHLNENKSPLTVLRGLTTIAADLPTLHLWLCFGAAPQLAEVHRYLRRHPHIRDRVHLLGRVPHDHVEHLMRAADLFVLGSHREGSGYSLIEALACGVTPVVTDIPSFRALTGNGRIGRLWPCGDALGFAAALKMAAANTTQARAGIREHFDATLSMQALGRLWMNAYQATCERAA